MFQLYFNIITLRKNAQDVPYSKWLIALWLGLDFALLVLVASLLKSEMSENLWLELFDVSFTAVCIYGLLWFTKHTPRFVQTYSAVLGVNVILFGCLTLLTLIFQSGQVFGVLAQPLYLWFIVVFVHILKDALDINTLKSVICVLSIEVLRLFILIELLKRFS